jgi:DNA-binding NarL/FixJ family response regulator
MSEIKIVIADDQELIRESLSIVLGMELDFSIVGVVSDGVEAVQICTEKIPDIVLMDMNMPNMDGVAATAEIKRMNPDIKVIILTSYQEVDYVVEALNNGAEGYLLKAINPKNLAAGIRLVHSGGTLVTKEMAIFLTKNDSKKSDFLGNIYGLNKREMQLLTLLSKGYKNNEIAEELFLSEGTVKNYISNIYSKLEVSSRREAAKKALDEGIIKRLL